MIDGVPSITWDPDLNEGGAKALRDYKIWGKEALDATGGTPVVPVGSVIDKDGWMYPTNSLHRFFKVTVEMP